MPEEMSRYLKVSKEEGEDFLEITGSNPTNRIFYFVLITTPILFFVFLEIALRIFHYGFDYTMWISPAKGLYVLNPDLPYKYFHSIQSVPQSDGDVFDQVKGNNSFRIFVLGESAAEGYPFMPNGAFSRYLQQRLSVEYPDSKIEVINCAITAINSYAMRDFMKGIVEEKPDLIIIYAGNNEYYGALGVGSMESFGTSRRLVNTVIYLEQFRTFQFLRNVLKGVAGVFQRERPATGTLMSRMAQNQYIGLNSKFFQEGIAQFEGNMTDILDMAKKWKVPVILGTLACNLKDQHPFVSIYEKGNPPAATVYLKAEEALAKKEYGGADSLFRCAKDLDALRFRPPSEINRVICKLGSEFNYPVVNIDSAFDALSPEKIVGDNLMTDHLHPTLRGYQIIGRLYYDEMERARLLPNTKPLGLTDFQQDSVMVANSPFSKFDSVISDYRIKVLKDDWPYVEEKGKKPIYELLSPKDYIDSLAYSLVRGNEEWITVQKTAARWYALREDTISFAGVMDVLISQCPFLTEYYDYAAEVLLKAKDYGRAYYYLARRNRIAQSAFSEKWLGIIDLSQNRLSSAKEHLSESLRYGQSDAQLWYNLTGVYVAEKNYPLALQAIQKTLALQPNFPDAAALQAQLLKTMRTQ